MERNTGLVCFGCKCILMYKTRLCNMKLKGSSRWKVKHGIRDELKLLFSYIIILEVLVL